MTLHTHVPILLIIRLYPRLGDDYSWNYLLEKNYVHYVSFNVVIPYHHQQELEYGGEIFIAYILTNLQKFFFGLRKLL